MVLGKTPAGENYMEKHVTALGALYIAFNILGLIFGLGAALLLIGVAGIPNRYADDLYILDIIGLAIGVLSVVLSVPGILGGIGLLKRKNWARILVIVLGFINLIHIPFGTVLGIYTLWVLLREETTKLFPSG